VTYEGATAATSYYNGYSFGSNIIPIKANGAFDAQLCIGKNATSGIHYVVVQVYGYVRGM
jgi:hypothetical protein